MSLQDPLTAVPVSQLAGRTNAAASCHQNMVQRRTYQVKTTFHMKRYVSHLGLIKLELV